MGGGFAIKRQVGKSYHPNKEILTSSLLIWISYFFFCLIALISLSLQHRREMIKVESLENHKRKKDMMGEKVGK